MRRVTPSIFAGILSLVVTTGCDKTSNEPVSLGGAPSASALPVGHPPIGGKTKSTAKNISGKVVETMDAGGYTYVLIDSKEGNVWAAVTRVPVKVGENVTVEQAMPMKDFESPTLKRKFDIIYFGVMAGAETMSPHAAGSISPERPAGSALAVPDEIKVDKAKGKNARTVEEVFAKAKELAGKEVMIRGIVVKVNKRIMGKNWVHLRDGTGIESKKNNDLVITSEEIPRVGETVVMVGKVATDKNFGFGYAYAVLVEEATFKTESGK